MILILISANKLVISSELTAENEGASMPSLRNLNEGPLDIHTSIQTSSCTTSVGLLIPSQGIFIEERAMLPQEAQLVGNGHYSFGTRVSLNLVEMPQVSPSLLSRNSGETNTVGEVIHGSALNPTHPKFYIVSNGVGKSLTNISAQFLEEQKGMKE